MSWRSFVIFVIVVALAGMLGGCRVECQAETRASKEQIAREQKAYSRGEGLCKELAYPRITLTDDRLLLKGVTESEVVRRNEISELSLTTIEPLEQRLRIYRDHFKQVRIAEPFLPTSYVTLDPELSTGRTASILMTAARAGFTESHLYVGDVDFTIHWWTPVVSLSDVDDRAGARAMCIESKKEGFVVRFDGQQDEGQTASSIIDLGSAITRACQGRPAPCANLIGLADDGRGPMRDAAKVAKTAFASQPFAAEHPLFLLATHAKLEDKGARARPCSLSSR